MKRVIIYFSVLLLFLLAGLSPVNAGFEEGLATFQRGDHETFFQELKPLAEQGNAEAQTSLGAMYASGQGVSRDYVMAYMWANLAASQGDETASALRSIVEKEMTPEQIVKAQRLFREFIVKNP